MKRLLRGAKNSEKKNDDTPSSPTSAKKSWASSAGIGALHPKQKQKRVRSGSHPQIRHLAMEGHNGPVVKATMDEIRRDASGSNSNLRINSFNLSPVTNPMHARASMDIPRRVDEAYIDDRLPPVSIASWVSDSAKNTLQQAQLRHEEYRDEEYRDEEYRDEEYQGEQHQNQHQNQRQQRQIEEELRQSIDGDAMFPPRTTSAVLMSAPPTPADAVAAPMQHRLSLALDANGRSPRVEFSMPVAAPSVPLPPNSAPVRGFPALSANDGHKRVISEKIKNLATRFSSSNLKEQSDSNSPVIRRRPSNTPSVSERVSQFDSQEHTNDPRALNIFGRFGMAVGNGTGSAMHSRSSSVAGSSMANGFNPSIVDQPSTTTASTGLAPEPAANRRPHSMFPTVNFGVCTDNASGTDNHAQSTEGMRPASSYINDYDFDDSNDDDEEEEDEVESVPTYRMGPNGRMALDHQATMAAGVQLSFSRSPSLLGNSSQSAMSSSPVGSTGYRGVRSDNASKRRGSLLSAFNAPEEPMHVASDHSLALRRAGSVVPTGPVPSASSVVPSVAAATASLAELQRNILTKDHTHDAVSRRRSQSHAPPAQPAVSDAAEAKHASTSDLPSSNLRSLNESTLLDYLSSNLQPLSARSQDNTLAAVASGDMGAAADLVEAMLASGAAGKVLSANEHERCVHEGAALRQRLQAARTRLTSELRTRDSAKSAADAAAKSTGTSVGMFNKSKYASNAQLNEDLGYAAARVQQTETEVSELTTKLRVVDAALHAHQAAVLAAAVRTLVAEAASEKAQAQLASEQAIREKERIQQESLDAQKSLESQVRTLQDESEGVASESQFARHSASLAVERLSGELTVLREQKLAAEQRAGALEARVDDALLRAQEAQQTADSASAQIESARVEAEAARHCVSAFSEGLRKMATPLRALGSVQDSAEKLRALSVDEVTPTNTPPATPTLALKAGPAPRTLTVDALDALPLDASIGAEGASAAMALLHATVMECTGLRGEAMRIGDVHARLQRDLATERRLREAQSLVITQQREKLGHLDQTVKEVADSLELQHKEAEKRWTEERRRLVDNIERLTLDAAALRAEAVAAVAAVGTIEPVTLPLQSVEKTELQAKITLLETQLAEQVERTEQVQREADTSIKAQAASKDVILSEYMRKLRDASAMLTSTATTAVEGYSDNGSGSSSPPAGSTGDAPRRLSRRRSLPTLSSSRRTTDSPVVLSAPIKRTAAVSDMQTATEPARDLPVSADESINQMLLAYSEKLMAKEDALRNREDELEVIRAVGAEIEAALYSMLPSARPNYGSIGRSSLNASPPMANVAWPYGSVPQQQLQHQHLKTDSNDSLRNRSASFFQGLRTNYLGMVDGPDMQIQMLTQMQHPVLAIRTDAQSLALTTHSAAESTLPSSTERTAPVYTTALKLGGADGVPSLIRNLAPLSQMVISEVRRLKNLICDLEDQSRDTRVELFDTQAKLSDLQSYCKQRSKQEDTIQQDITHVLAQITRLRTRVVELESEKAKFEVEAQQLHSRCRKMEDRTAEHVLDLIVDRVGQSEWARAKHLVTDASAAATNGGRQPDFEAKAVPARFASVSSISVSHPEASDIRAEFNELLHQVIAKRDEDLERMQVLADAWRADAHKTSRANESKAWNTSTRGIQTI
ncbi:hypothetical protein LPJ66_004541 [Kickxella alabastrina]|uniref:Uncharacterized protein n=1 Tax=Kickxella alabastrina TaxID=61397 RepID=A0ACC1IHM2_9FUNG|nr:hypothetical protein LPJ66_004541 [Kickxella alabastrina]